jgi:hypothetical protein
MQNSALAETQSWLTELCKENPPKISHLDQESLQYLHRISIIARKKEDQAQILLSNSRKMTVEFLEEGKRTESILQKCNLNSHTLKQNILSSLALLSCSSVILGTPDASLASLCVAVTDLDSRRAKEENTQKQLQSALEAISIAAEDSKARHHELEVTHHELKTISSEAAERNLDQAERLSRQYAEASRLLKVDLHDAGVNDSIYHSRLVKDAEQVKALHERLRPLRARLASYFQLPPDARLARAELQAARGRLEEVEQKLQDSIAAIVVGSNEADL